MNKIRILMLAIAVTCAAASAYLGQVVSSFLSAGGDRTYGIARSGSYLYETCYEPYVLICNPLNGYIISSFPIPSEATLCALTYSAGPDYVWVLDYASVKRVFYCHPKTGSIYGSWPLTYTAPGITAYCTGDGGVGTSYLITHDRTFRRFHYVVPTTGSVVKTFSYAHETLYDCAYDWRNNVIWMGARYSNLIYAYDAATGSVRDSFPPPKPTPQTLTYYGEYLYVFCNSSPRMIYKVHCPKGMSAVAPASVGRIKVLYR